MFSVAGLVAAALTTRYVLPALVPDGARGTGLRAPMGRAARVAVRWLPRTRVPVLVLGVLGDADAERRALLLATAVGVLFGVLAVLTKIVMNTVTQGHAARLLVSPVAYLLVLVGVAATLLQQSAFHAGSLRASVPAMLVLEPIVAVLLGQVILGEHLTVSTPTAVVLGMALAAMAAATITLGRDEGAYEEELEAGRKTQAARRSER